MIQPPDSTSQFVRMPPLQFDDGSKDSAGNRSGDVQKVLKAADALLREVVDTASRFFAGLRSAAAWQSVSGARKYSKQLRDLSTALLAESPVCTYEALRHWMVAEEPTQYFLRQVDASGLDGRRLSDQLINALQHLRGQRTQDRDAAEVAAAHIQHMAGREHPIRSEVWRFFRQVLANHNPDDRVEDADSPRIRVPQSAVAMDTFVALLSQPPNRRRALSNVLAALQEALPQANARQPPPAASPPGGGNGVIPDDKGARGPTGVQKVEESKLRKATSASTMVREAASGTVGAPPTIDSQPPNTLPPPAEIPETAAPSCCPPVSLFLRNGVRLSVRSHLTRLTQRTGKPPLPPSRPRELSCDTEIIPAPILDAGPDRFVCIREGLAVEDLVFLEAAFLEYKRTPRALRRLEHSDPSRELWPPLIPSSLRVGCGRRECSADISQLDRAERICPGCNQPILSRCGNPECQEEFLHLDADGKEVECQACGCPNVNQYWTCPRHKDEGPFSTLQDPCCPECIQEWGWKARPRRPDLISKGVLQCPGCLTVGRRSPFRIPHRVRELFLSQEPIPRDRNKEQLCVEAGLGREGCCPQCTSQLIPFVEEAAKRCAS